MRRKSVCASALFVFAVSSGHLRADTTILVDFGRFPSAEAAGNAEDSVGWMDADRTDDTACTQCFAALEIQRYLREMTGRPEDFSIRDDNDLPQAGDLIFVGVPSPGGKTHVLASALIRDEELAHLGAEGYRIKSTVMQGRRVVLVAGAERVGTLYGAYDLLYRLGCRWFAPGQEHEEVSRIQHIPDLDLTERPSFLTRGFLAWENRGNPDFLLWMARNRLDYWCVEQAQHGLMRKLGIRLVCGLHDAEERFLNPPAPYPYNHTEFVGDEQQPADPYAVSTMYAGDVDKNGRLSYFEAHPEWFALESGRRVPGIKGWFGTNYCTSNPDATTEFMKNYLQALVDGPYRDADIVRFWTLDGGKWCPCPQCQALGTNTDRNLLLVHRLAQEIQRARQANRVQRPISITFLAYADVVQPPSRPLPSDFDYAMCSATFYPIRRCYVHDLDAAGCTSNEDYRRHLAGWAQNPGRHYRGQLAIGEYYNVSVYKCLPICFMHGMDRDIPAYYQVGARHFDYMHVTTSDWGSKALTNYQMARQLWDVHTDCEALWQDYFVRRYGPAAGAMRKFYESLEQMFSNVTELKYGLARRLERGAEDLFPNAQLRYRREPGLDCGGPTLLEIVDHSRRCRQLLDEASALPLPPRIAARVSEDERCFVYGERTVAYYHACVDALRDARAGRRAEAQGHFARAQRLADQLRTDKISAADSSSHANAENALAATLASGALPHVDRLLRAAK